MKKQLLDNTIMVPSLIPSVTPLSAGTATGLTVDRSNFLSLIALVSVGAASGAPTDQSVIAQVFHGDESNGSDAVLYQPDGDTLATPAVVADDSYAAVQVDLAGAKRYITIKFVVAFTDGTTPAIPVVGTLALGDPNYTEDIS